MGLDAFVYKSMERLKSEYPISDEVIEFDDYTCEIWLKEDITHPNISEFQNEAIDVRIGNISAVADIRCEIKKILPRKSIILSKILYDGTHCGDRIKVKKIPKIEKEIKIVASKILNNEDLKFVNDFLIDLERLCKAALENNNPICF